jgi:DnaJ-class molecular chaperone
MGVREVKLQTNFYQVLGLKNFASHDEIKKAHRALARKYHPDLGGSVEKMQMLNSVYDILYKKKDTYDAWLREQLNPAPLFSFTVSMNNAAAAGSGNANTNGWHGFFYGGFTA